MKMLAGTVKRWSDAKGYGLIAPDHGGELFVRYDGLSPPRTLTEGARVTFAIARGPLGQQAIRVRPA